MSSICFLGMFDLLCLSLLFNFEKLLRHHVILVDFCTYCSRMDFIPYFWDILFIPRSRTMTKLGTRLYIGLGQWLELRKGLYIGLRPRLALGKGLCKGLHGNGDNSYA